MSNPKSALGGASFAGFSHISDVGPLGMITLRAKAELAELSAAIKAATGCAAPQPRRIVHGKESRAAGWMSPDEYLLIMPYDKVGAALAGIESAMGAAHYLAVDVSDARAVFRIEGEHAGDVLRKLAPVDLDTLAQNELRRTRIAQVPAAFWAEGEGFTLVCFRSVAGYAMNLLSNAAQSKM